MSSGREFQTGFNATLGVVLALVFVCVVIPAMCCLGFIFIGAVGQTVHPVPIHTTGPTP